MGALWSAFCALIIRRTISLKSFIYAASIWSNIHSLWFIDNTVQTKKFIKKTRKRTKHGFPINIFLSSDDSNHYKRNQHVHNITDFETSDDMLAYIPVPFCPNYRLVSSAPNEVKADNYLKNSKDIINLLGMESVAYIGGGLNDNARDAI